MSNPNRYAVTVRLNTFEKADLRALMEFWKKDEKTVMKLAFYQLVQATNEVQKKMKQQQESEECQATPSEVLPSSSESVSQSDSQPSSAE